MRFRVRRSSEVFRGRVFRLVNQDVVLPGGREAVFNIVEHPGAVALVPVFDDGDVLLLKQFRPAARASLYEIPAGTREPGESPRVTALRELIEETGYAARRLRKIAEFYTAPGFCTERMHLYVATGLRERPGADQDEDEVIRTVRMPFRRALRMAYGGQVRDAKSIVGLLLAWRALNGGAP